MNARADFDDLYSLPLPLHDGWVFRHRMLMAWIAAAAFGEAGGDLLGPKWFPVYDAHRRREPLSNGAERHCWRDLR